MSRSLANINNSFVLAGFGISEVPTTDSEILIFNAATQTWIIASISSGGGVTGGANVGTGTGQVFKTVASGIMQFRNLLSGTGLTIVTATDDVQLEVNPVQTNIQSITSGTGTLEIPSTLQANNDFYVLDKTFLTNMLAYEVFTLPAKVMSWNAGTNQVEIFDSSLISGGSYTFSNIAAGTAEILKTPVVGTNIDFYTLASDTLGNIIWSNNPTNAIASLRTTLQYNKWQPTVTNGDLTIDTFNFLSLRPNVSGGAVQIQTDELSGHDVNLYWGDIGTGAAQYAISYLRGTSQFSFEKAGAGNGSYQYYSPGGTSVFAGDILQYNQNITANGRLNLGSANNIYFDRDLASANLNVTADYYRIKSGLGNVVMEVSSASGNPFFPVMSLDTTNSNNQILLRNSGTGEIKYQQSPWVYSFPGYASDILLNNVTNGILFMTYTLPALSLECSFDLYMYSNTGSDFSKRYRFATGNNTDTGYLFVNPSESGESALSQRVHLNIRINGSTIYFKAIGVSIGGTPIGFNFKFIDNSYNPGTYTLNTSPSTETLSTTLFNSGVRNVGLDDLYDTVITTPQTGQTLRYDGTNWVNTIPITPTAQIIQTSSVPTITLTTATTYYAMAPVSSWSFAQNSSGSWFLTTSPAGRLKLTQPGIVGKFVEIKFTQTFTLNTASQTLTWGIFQNGTIVGGSEFQQVAYFAGFPQNINIMFTVFADTNDEFEVRIRNDSGPGTVFTMAQTNMICTLLG